VLRAYAPDPSHYRSSAAPAWLDELDLSVAEQHLRMGTRSLPAEQWLLSDEHAAEELALRRRLLREQRSLVFACTPHAEAAAREAAELVRQTIGALIEDDHPLARAGGSVQEDLCLVVHHHGAWHLEGAVLCFPSLWMLGEKLGRPLSNVHEPVAHYAEELSARVDTFFDRLPSDRLVWRRNFSVWPELWLWAPCTSFDEAFGGSPSDLWIRSERQTLRRLPQTGTILFTIRVQVTPVAVLADRPDRALDLATWLASPAGAERRRQLGAASAPLAAWLRDRAADG
jgi:dimethylamine monooxygenase subunit A